MAKKYADRARFLTIYIREAHPLDEWQMTSNETEGVCYKQPQSQDERRTIARDFVTRFKYEIPLSVDRIGNEADEIYAGWPERLYIIDENKRIAFKGEMGPFGFDPEKVDAWLAAKQ